MPLHSAKCFKPVFYAALCIIGFGIISCKGGDNLPKKLDFQYGNGPILLVNGEYFSITLPPGISNAQEPATGKNSYMRRIVFLSKNDAKSIWKKLKKLKHSDYENLDNDDFKANPPDMNYNEKLKLVVDDKIYIDLYRESSRFNNKLSRPLEEIYDLMIDIFNKRQNDFIIPKQFGLRLTNLVDGQIRGIELIKQMDDIIIKQPSRADIEVDRKQFTDFFGYLQNSNCLGREFGLATPPPAGDSSANVYSLRAIIEHYAVREFDFPREFTGKEHFDILWDSLVRMTYAKRN